MAISSFGLLWTFQLPHTVSCIFFKIAWWCWVESAVFHPLLAHISPHYLKQSQVPISLSNTCTKLQAHHTIHMSEVAQKTYVHYNGVPHLVGVIYYVIHKYTREMKTHVQYTIIIFCMCDD